MTLESSKLSSAFGQELEDILKQAGIGDVIKRVALTEIPGTKPWVIGRAQQATRHAGKAGGAVAKTTATKKVAPGVYDVSSLAKQMGL